ncbi:MAG: tagaturonate epimerase family protein [Anaerohalosphaeraceae bacterium]
MKIEKYSFGVGDRFCRQGKAQLQAIIQARQAGVEIVPVWNKSFREHSIIGTNPVDTRREADHAVKQKNWQGGYYVDADHIHLKNVDGFIETSNFFTLDVAEGIGKPAEPQAFQQFITDCKPYMGSLRIAGIEESFLITADLLTAIGEKYLSAVQQAGQIYQRIAQRKGEDRFVTEVSMDESDLPQTPVELFFILKMLAQQKVPVQTIAPKFTGRFNKGVDYVGNVRAFEKEFRDDIAVIRCAVKEFGLSANLKLSVHSGSDKFSIYASIHRALKDSGAGVHIKTAGTTWLEEVIGLAEAGGLGLDIAREIYAQAYDHCEQLCAPYATVIDIDPTCLPDPLRVADWDEQQYTSALRHDPGNPGYNPHFRQLLHVGYKIAAQMGRRYLDAVEKYETVVSRNVTENLFERHLKRIFLNQR